MVAAVAVGVAGAEALGGALLGMSAPGVEAPGPESHPPGNIGGSLWWTLGTVAAAGLALWVIRRKRLLRLDGRPDAVGGTGPDWPIMLLAGFAVMLAQPLGAGTARAVFGLTPASTDQLQGVALLSVGGYLGALVALLVATVVVPGLGRGLGVRPGGRDLLRGAGAMALAAPIVAVVGQAALWSASALARWRGGPPPDPEAHSTLRLLTEPGAVGTGWWWAVVGAVVIGAPIVEESIYRGLFQSAVRGATGRRWGAIWLTSGAFTLMHAGVAEPHALAVLLVLSVCFGVAYERTGRLWVPITMHALFNGANVALAAGSS